MSWTPFISKSAAAIAANTAIAAGRAARATIAACRYVDPEDGAVELGVRVRLFNAHGAFVGCL